MNYVKLVKKFWEFNKEKHLDAKTISLYLFLLNKHFCNNCKEFSISHSKISKELGISIRNIIISKQKINDLGLIEFVTNVGLSSKYNIIYDY